MKFSSSIVLAALTTSVHGHYFFDKLIIAGRETGAGEYVRTSTRATKYNPIKWENVRDNSTPDLDDIICNQGAFASAGRTKTAEITAGTKVGFKLAVGATMQHPGPGLAYLSKAPTTAQAYEGKGEWFKIFEEGVCNQSGDFTKDAWCTWDKNVIEFDIPKNTPNGEYLLRVEHIGIHGAHVGQAEFYPACAQIKVVGGAASGNPGPTIKWPGGYKKTDASFNFSIYGGHKPYPMPGPAVWDGTSTSPDTGSAPETPASTAAPVAAPTTPSTPAEPAAPSAAAPSAPAAVPSAPAAVPSAAVPSAPAAVPSAPAVEPVTPPATGGGSTCGAGRRARRNRRSLMM